MKCQLGEYKTHFDCATAGYLNAMGLMRELGPEEVDRSLITVQFKPAPVLTQFKLLW